MIFRPTNVLIGFFLLFSAVGCVSSSSSPYLDGFRFGPEPALAVMFKPGTQSSALSVLASVVGVRRGDPDHGIPRAVEIRMRFENGGQESATFDPKSLSLVNGSLQPFTTPEVHPSAVLEIPAGQTKMASVFFPFSPEISSRRMSLDAIRLRWEVMLEGKPYLQSVTFERISPLYYDAQ